MKNQSNYHSIFLNLLRKKVKASFVGYVETKGKYQLKVIVNKVPTYFDLVGTPNDVTPQRYLELIENIELNVQESI
jgi:hypothetical protein